MTERGNSSTRRQTPIIALLIANAISMVGNNLQAVAIPWFVLETTGSAARTGVVAFAAVLPTVIAAVFGGAIVDRLGRWRVSVWADIVSALSAGMIPLLVSTVGLDFWLLLILVAMGAVLDAPGNTARMAMVPDLAELGGMRLERANSASQAIQSLSLLVGPVLAGVAIVWLGPTNTLWVNAGSFVLSALVVGFLVPRADGLAADASRYLDDVREGFAVIRADSFLIGTIVVGALANFAGAPLLAVLLPVFAREVYGEATDLGWILGAIGLGSLAGALFFGVSGGNLPRWPLLAGLSLLSPLPLFALMTSPPLVIALLALVIAGFADGAMNPLIITAVQERVPKEMLGRVMGTMLASILAAAPLGMIAMGTLAEAFGVITTLGLAGAVLVLVFVIVAGSPALRGIGDAPAREELVA